MEEEKQREAENAAKIQGKVVDKKATGTGKGKKGKKWLKWLIINQILTLKLYSQIKSVLISIQSNMVEKSETQEPLSVQDQISKHLAEQFNATVIKHDFFMSALPQKSGKG